MEWGLGVGGGSGRELMGQGLVQHRGVWSSLAPLPSWAPSRKPSFPRTTPTHCPALGVCGDRPLLELLLPPVRVPRVQTIPIFLRQIPESRMWRGGPHGPLSSPRVPLEAEGPAVCSPAAATGPGLAGVPLRCVSAPHPLSSCFQNHHPGKECSPQMPASPSCEIWLFHI